MRRRDADAGRGAHGLEQIICKLAERIVERGDGVSRHREPAVGIADDRANGHASS